MILKVEILNVAENEFVRRKVAELVETQLNGTHRGQHGPDDPLTLEVRVRVIDDTDVRLSPQIGYAGSNAEHPNGGRHVQGP